MSSPIFILQKDENKDEQEATKIIQMNEQPFNEEKDLQHLLAKHPELLLSDYLGIGNSNLLLVKKEAMIPGDEVGATTFYLDHLFLDRYGIPTLVEVKRSSNTQIRREVVGQMLDYAANALLYLPVEEIRGMFNTTWEVLERKPEDVLAKFLDPDADIEAFWNEVKKNLLSGNIRIVFASDSIPDSLKNIVQFLNNQMNPAEVLAVDIRKFVNGDLQVIVPKVIGQAPLMKKSSSTSNRQWDETSFNDELPKNLSPEDIQVVKKLFDWARKNSHRIWWGQGRQNGEFTPLLPVSDNQSMQIFSVRTTGSIEIQLESLRYTVNLEKIPSFIQMLNAISGIYINPSRRTPSFSVSLLRNEENYSKFIKAVESFMSNVNTV